MRATALEWFPAHQDGEHALSGLLIVNADDWGHDVEATNAIHRAFDASRITSATGMVYMADSNRAADIANRAQLPIGFHINLTEPFSDPSTPADVRKSQLRLIDKLGGTPRPDEPPDMPSTAKLRRWLYDPRIQADVDLSVSAQLQRFLDLYKLPPTHFDGHNHIDLCPNVFCSGAIPAGVKMRNSLYRYPVERSIPALARTFRQAWRARRFPSTRYIFHIKDLRLSGPLDPRLALSDQVPVEVMGHPGFAAENAMLMSLEWGEVLCNRHLGSFADLQGQTSSLREAFRLLPVGLGT